MALLNKPQKQLIYLSDDDPFPDMHCAFTQAEGANGLLAAGGNLSPKRLLSAYQQGIFPWFTENQPILWWSPDPRMVMFTDQFKVSRSLKKSLQQTANNPEFAIRFDTAFTEVMRACAQPRADQPGTWISPAMINAYTQLHKEGYAHSSELWLNKHLVGGAYGVSIGRMFFGESMFSRISNASKIALSWLVYFLHQQGVNMIDCQQHTQHLASLGAKEIPRDQFLNLMKPLTMQDPIVDWLPRIPEAYL